MWRTNKLWIRKKTTNQPPGHSIRHTFLVAPLFFLQPRLNSSWHRFNKVILGFLVLVDMTASQICQLHIHDVTPVPLWKAKLDCDLMTGGHFTTVNSLSCSRNQSETAWALRCDGRACRSSHQKMSTLWSQGDAYGQQRQLRCDI